jgi:L-arabinose isomerase
MEYNVTGSTVGLYSCAKEGNVCIVNLAPTKDGFSLVLCPGKVLNVAEEGNTYTLSTQGWFKPELPLTEFLEKYSMAGGTHHSAMVYDVDMEDMKAFGKMMGFDVVVVA